MAVQKTKVIYNQNGQKIILYQRDKKPYVMMVNVPNVLWLKLLAGLQPDLPLNCRVRFYGTNDQLYDVLVSELLERIKQN
jgi:hypothetical protein